MQPIIREYLAWKAGTRPRAAINYRRSLSKYLAAIGDKDVLRADINDLIKFRQSLDRYAQATVRFDLTAVKNFYKYCRLSGHHCIHPSLIDIPRARSKPHHALSLEEFEQIIRQFNEWQFESLRKLIMIRMLYETGMRVSELCSLNISQIDSQKMKTLIPNRKNSEYREVYWSQETHKLLLRYLGTRLCINQSAPLFISLYKRTRLTTRSVERFFKEAYQNAELQVKAVPHSCRHGRAHKILQTEDISTVQRVLGHSDIRSTQWYTQFSNHELEIKARRCL